MWHFISNNSEFFKIDAKVFSSSRLDHHGQGLSFDAGVTVRFLECEQTSGRCLGVDLPRAKAYHFCRARVRFSRTICKEIAL